MFVVGLALVIYFAEKLVKGAVGTAIGFGISAFLVSVIFIGFDPENLAVGTVGSAEEVAGIALGSIIGAGGGVWVDPLHSAPPPGVCGAEPGLD